MGMPVESLAVACFPSELGWMAIVGQGDCLHELTFGHATPQSARRALHLAGASLEPSNWRPDLARRLQAFASGRIDEFCDVRLAEDDQTEFQQAVNRECREIAFGRTLTYGELAQAAGFPRAARAVGSVMARNRTPLIVPCHRVVPSGAGPGGYSARGGTRMKLRLLEAEALATGRAAKTSAA